MIRTLVIDRELFVPLAEASGATGYSTEYLARLARMGRLRGRIIANMWFVEAAQLLQLAQKNRREGSRR